MSFVSSQLFPPFHRRSATQKDDGLLVRILRAGEYMRGIRVRMRYGHLTRNSLRLLRFAMQEDTADCEWVARLPDIWDTDLPLRIQYRHASLQALRDAIDIRAMLFDLMPHVVSARLRVYRETGDGAREPIINGCVERSDRLGRDVHSLAMRAKTLGFHFDLDGDHLRSIADSCVASLSHAQNQWEPLRVGPSTGRSKAAVTRAVGS
jgi:hypothetical protein